jgi:hypothetical protein
MATARPESPSALIICVQLGTPPRDTVQELLARPEGGSLSQLFGRAKYKHRNRHGNPDANTKTCPDSNANANVSHRCTDTCTKYNTNEYAQRQSSYAPA